MSKRRILTVTPLQEEHAALCSSLENLGFRSENDKIGKLDACRFPALGMTVARGGHGKTQFGIQTQYLLDQARFDLVLCVGAAGSLAPEVQVGDLIVATATFEHDYNLKFAQRPNPQFAGDVDSIGQIKRVDLKDMPFKIHFGIMASGDEDVIEVARGRELRTLTHALGVAWEGVGGARACAFNGVPFLELRVATDTADHTAPVIFDENLKIVMNHISILLVAWLR